MKWGQARHCAIVWGIAACAAADPVPDCRQRIPAYVTLGAKRMLLTEEAEQVLCRNDSQLKKWEGGLSSAPVLVVEDGVIASLGVVSALGAQSVEFRRCVFPNELVLTGRIQPSLTFRECEFRGNMDVRNADLLAGLAVRSSVFHQDLHVLNSRFTQPLTIEGSILTSRLQLEQVFFGAGLRILGSRLLGGIIGTGVRSPVGAEFQGARLIGSITLTDTEMAGSLRFSECEWDRSAAISMSRGVIGGGVRFDSCAFDGTWRAGRQSDRVLLRFSDLTLGSAFTFSGAASRDFPELRLSRCVIPLMRLPEWGVARLMVLPESGEATDPRIMEERGEVLQLLQSSYATQGRTRDASAARNAHEQVIAEIKGGPTRWIRIAAGHFGSGLWWLVGIVCSFAVLLVALGRRWGIHPRNASIWYRVYSSVDMSVKGFLGGPPEGKDFQPAAVWCLRAERILGMMWVFLWGLLISGWTHG